MRFLKWRKSHSVFVPEIDDEHRIIFATAGELQQTLAAAAPLYQIQEILHRLIACVEDHFAHEEQLMRKERYLSFEWHKQQHDTVRKRMKQFVPLIETGDPEAGTALIEFLSHWLRNHTGLTDRMMGAFLRNQQRAHIA
jgi:hemerythrin-like metal-binding protein